MRARTSLRAAGLSIAVVAAVSAAGPASGAVPRAVVVPCGAVLTASVRLAADVVCPDGNGITLAADGVELNLNGHRLVGPGARPGTAGVEITALDTVVRNGRISGWGTGVVAGVEIDTVDEPELRSGTVRQVRMDGNVAGVSSQVQGDLVVRDSRLDGNRVGADAYVTSRLLVDHSTLEGNGLGATGFANVDRAFVVRDSLVRGNRTGVSCDQDADVIVTGTTLQRNTTGLDVSGCSADVSASRFVWNGTHVTTYLLPGDELRLACTSFTRDGGPVAFPVEPC